MSFVSLFLCVCLFASLVSPFERQTTKFSDKMIRDLVLTPDGKGINFDALEQMIKQLIQLNEDAKRLGSSNETPSSDWANEAVGYSIKSPTPALDEYLTVGRRPSTTHFLGLSVACDVCASLVNVVGPVLHQQIIWNIILKLGRALCPMLIPGTAENTCKEYVDSYGPVLYYIWPNVIKAPYTLCGSVLPRLGCGAPDNKYFLWEVPIPKPLSTPLPPVSGDEPAKDKLTVLFMTDLHIDEQYEPGSIAECGDPICCRSSSVPPKSSSKEGRKAGKWGDYGKCDIPLATFDDMLRHINETQGDEIDFVMIGGDLLAHDSWEANPEANMARMEMVAKKFSEKLQGKRIFFTLGNHETTPVGCYAFPDDPGEFSSQWLYEKSAEVWMKWLNPSESEQEKTIKKGGFYTTILKKGWRLISLNTNFCHKGNWFMYGRTDITDPYEHLQWLVDVLAKAESDGERVLIVTHVQPGDGGCFQAWSWNYYRIINRFAHIITGQLHGHAHLDYFVMYYDAETLTQPKSMGFIGPPATTYPTAGKTVGTTTHNVGYRLYDFEPKNFTMLNFRQYYADIGAENAKPNLTQIDWSFEYSAKEEYSLEDMSAASWSDFTKRMHTNLTLFDIYIRHHLLSVVLTEEPCGESCHRERLCEIYNGLADSNWCERFYPSKPSVDNDPSKRICSSRFVKDISRENYSD